VILVPGGKRMVGRWPSRDSLKRCEKLIFNDRCHPTEDWFRSLRQ
jgi:hypothetical protein